MILNDSMKKQFSDTKEILLQIHLLFLNNDILGLLGMSLDQVRNKYISVTTVKVGSVSGMNTLSLGNPAIELYFNNKGCFFLAGNLSTLVGKTVPQLTAVKLMEDVVRQRGYRKSLMELTRRHKVTGIPYYETIFWASMLLNNGLAIMPTKNLINNIGLTADSTHYTASEKTTPRGLRKIFTMKRFELNFPLHHPKYVIDNVAYKERLYRRNAWNHPWIKVGRSLEELVLNLRYGNFKVIGKAIANRLRKTFGR